MKRAAKSPSRFRGRDHVNALAFYLSISLLVIVPLAFSTRFYRIYSIPKFAILLVGSAALLPLLAWSLIDPHRRSASPASLLA
jgi:hypothetical protein